MTKNSALAAVHDVRLRLMDAEQAVTACRVERDDAMRRAVSVGCTLREVARVAGVTPAYVHRVTHRG